jgi:hypothetical protein
LTKGATVVIVHRRRPEKGTMKRQYHKPSLSKREKLSAVTAGRGPSNFKTEDTSTD